MAAATRRPTSREVVSIVACSAAARIVTVANAIRIAGQAPMPDAIKTSISTHRVRKPHRESKNRHCRGETEQKGIGDQEIEMLCNGKHQHDSDHGETSSGRPKLAAVQEIEGDPGEHEKE